MFLEYKYSSIAQLVEHAAVNRRVVGSSPTGGATSERTLLRSDFFTKKSGTRAVVPPLSQKRHAWFACSPVNALTYGSLSLPPFCDYAPQGA